MIILDQNHSLCAPEVAEKFEWYFSALVPIMHQRELVLDFSGSRLQTYRDSGFQFEISGLPETDRVLGAFIRWYVPKRGDLVFDIGASSGLSTFHFSKYVGTSGRVVAFEPRAQKYALLQRNIERHKLRNVIPVRDGITATAERSNTMTLSAAFEYWGIPQLCKIDAQGAESDVIRASEGLLRKVDTQFVGPVYVGGMITGARRFPATPFEQVTAATSAA